MIRILNAYKETLLNNDKILPKKKQTERINIFLSRNLANNKIAKSTVEKILKYEPLYTEKIVISNKNVTENKIKKQARKRQKNNEKRLINKSYYEKIIRFAYENNTQKQLNVFGNETVLPSRYEEYIFKEGLFARQFPISDVPIKGRHDYGKLDDDIVEVSDNYSGGKMWNTGVMRHGVFYTYDTEALGETPITLRDILQPESEVDEKYYLTDEQIEKFEYLRGAKKIERTSADGHKYFYSEGGMSPHDDLDLPGRTMLTSEGSINRSTHLLLVNGRYRFITPIEAERMQDFPDEWTKMKKLNSGEIKEVTDRMRLFFMGNALVTGVVKRIADELDKLDSFK